MLQGLDLGNLIIGLAFVIIGIGVLLSCYTLISIGIYIWERITGNTLEDTFKNCLPWYDKKS